MGDWERELTADERRRVAAARRKVFLLYEGRVTPHRSCGIAMAETFGLPTAPYQALRRGGLTGAGECGVIVAGRLILGQWLGDPDPAGPVTPTLRAAMSEYDARFRSRMDRGGAPGDSNVCQVLTGPFPSFASPERAAFCTALATEVGTLVAEIAVRNDVPFEVTPIPGVSAEEFTP